MILQMASTRCLAIDTHAELFPEATTLFNLLYGVSSPVFVFEENGDLSEMASEEGSWQGCAAGCEAFCLTSPRLWPSYRSGIPSKNARMGGILLPRDAPVPPAEILALFDPDFVFRFDGFR